MSERLFKNWKSTVSGLGTAIIGIVAIIGYDISGAAETVITVISGLSAVIGMLSKDK